MREDNDVGLEIKTISDDVFLSTLFKSCLDEGRVIINDCAVLHNLSILILYSFYFSFTNKQKRSTNILIAASS